VKSNSIRTTSPDKVHGKLVKYRQGDCLSIDCNNGHYLAVLISEKFNKYYDFTLLEYYKDRMPKITDFTEGQVFGTRFGSWEELMYGVDKRMFLCKYVDNCAAIQKIGSVHLIPGLVKAAYTYFNSIDELLNNYLEEIPIRIEKTKNAEKFPDLAFVSKHLIKMRNITTEIPNGLANSK